MYTMPLANKSESTEKVPGMFGTLVICLPSEHVGGAVRLDHQTQTQRLETEPFSKFNISYLAWYADVLHEVCNFSPFKVWLNELGTHRFCVDRADQDGLPLGSDIQSHHCATGPQFISSSPRCPDPTSCVSADTMG